jgi:hypothetical protein
MQAKDQLDRIPPMAISGQPGAAAPNPPENENILKTKVFLTFVDSKTVWRRAGPAPAKLAICPMLPKKQALRTKLVFHSARKLSTFPSKIER